ncbi:hypothetical protein [Duganella qianjiadongensis]|uniref:ZP domain-containing protein n=1 Tax=Duganella qianjiadongensis TaxID=2692176 RepID=A0ABW9VHJ5_9BURK|nr:hypothetical protein [Duganella qianjiadongensis]MYM38981.1 hypothetical protein [Duganella qianjiadongensis]
MARSQQLVCSCMEKTACPRHVPDSQNEICDSVAGGNFVIDKIFFLGNVVPEGETVVFSADFSAEIDLFCMNFKFPQSFSMVMLRNCDK